MNINKLKLEKFAHYKNKNLDYNKYYIFFIVYDKKDGEILESKNFISKNDFDEEKFLKNLGSRKNSLRKRVQFYYIPISDNKQITKDFRELKEIFSNIEDIKNNMNDRVILPIFYWLIQHYQFLLIFLLFVYTVYFYSALVGVGIPLQTINIGIKDMLSIYSERFFGFFGLFGAIFIYAYFIFFILFILVTIVRVIALKFKKIPFLYYKYTLYGFIKEISIILLNMIVASMFLLYIALIFYPLAHAFWDKLKINAHRADKFQPSDMYQIYLQNVGYPKIAKQNGKQYIFVGHDKSYEYLYDLNLSKQYIMKKERNRSKVEKKTYMQFCRNILDNNESWDIIYEFLRNSPELSAHKAEQVKIKDSNFTYKSLDYITEDLNTTKLYKECKEYIKDK